MRDGVVFSPSVEPEGDGWLLKQLQTQTCVIFEPPKTLNMALYMCSTTFIVDPILEMYKHERRFGVALIAGNGYRLYQLKVTGTHITPQLLAHDTEQLQKKQKKGGQSAPRFERIRQEKQNHYARRIAEQMVEVYTSDNHTQSTIEGLVVAGPGLLKREVMKEDAFAQYFRSKVLTVVESTDVTSTLIDTIIETHPHLWQADSVVAAEHLQAFWDLVVQADERLVFGVAEVQAALDQQLLQRILVHPLCPPLTVMEGSPTQVLRSAEPRLLRDFEGVVGVLFYKVNSDT